jgi:hypothetical protein
MVSFDHSSPESEAMVETLENERTIPDLILSRLRTRVQVFADPRLPGHRGAGAMSERIDTPRYSLALAN